MEVANSFDSLTLETAENKKSSTFSFFLKWLENVISEGEKSVSFKTNLLNWVSPIFNIIFQGY